MIKYALPLVVSITFIIVIYILSNRKLNISSRNYIAYSCKNNKILLKKNHKKSISVGSILKILTVITALDYIKDSDLNTKIVITPKMIEKVDRAASVVGYSAGTVVTIEEVLYSIILASGADATAVLSHYIFGNEDLMVGAMNKKSKEIGMYRTRIANTSGLDSTNQFTTLLDILALMKYSIKNSIFIEIYTKQEYKFKYWDKKIINRILTLDKSLGINYLTGAKSGFTNNAKRCLASISYVNNDCYIVISTHAESKRQSNNLAYLDTVKIYDYLLSTFG